MAGLGLTAVSQRTWALLSLALALGVALAAVMPALLADGIVATRAAGDSPFNLQRVHQMAVALADRQFPPRWMPDAAYGLGMPFWNYYAPLVWLWAGAVALAGGGAVGAIKVTQALCFLVAAAGAWRLARDTWGSAPGALLASAAYSLAPYHMVNVYARGDALSELGAYAVFPWLLVAVDSVVRRPTPRRAAVLAVLTAMLLLAHNVSALLFLPVLAAFVTWRLFTTLLARRSARFAAPPSDAPPRPKAEMADVVADIMDRAPAGRPPEPWVVELGTRLAEWESRLWPLRRMVPTETVAVGGSLLLGALLAAFFWLPALMESDAVQLAGNTSGYFDFRNHFLNASLLRPSLLYEYDAAAGAPVGTSLVQLLLAIGGVVAAMRLTTRRGHLIFWSAVAVVSTLFMTALSLPVWRSVPLLSFAQFPWRWLGVQALALALLAGALPPGLAMLSAKWREGAAWVTAIALAAIFTVSALGDLRPEVIAIAPPTRAHIHAFEVFSGNPGTTVRGEYLPTTVAPRPVSSVDVVIGREGDPVALTGTLGSATLLRHGSSSQEWQVEVSDGREAMIAFPTLHFPGFLVQVDDDVPLEASPAHGSGWISVIVPPGVHVVRLWLGRTTVRALAELVSLGALAMLLALWLSAAGLPGRSWRYVAVVALTFAASAVIARALPTGMAQGRSPGPVTMDWTLAPWPHPNPRGVSYGVVRLIDVTTSAGGDGVEAGTTLMVSPSWRGECAECSVEIALVSPAEVQFAVPDEWAVARDQLDGPAMVLDLPAETPPGIYFVRMRLLDEDDEELSARSNQGRPIGPIYLGPLRVMPAGGEEPPVAPEGEPVLRLVDLRVHDVKATRQDEWLLVTMTWVPERTPIFDVKTSLRLMAGDEVIVQEDKVPLYGYSPPTSWQPGYPVTDRRWLTVPDELPDGPYDLKIIAYDEASGEELARGIVEDITLERP